MLMALLTACYSEMPTADVADGVKLVTFNLTGEGFGSPTFTRATALDESDMTDLWVFDFEDEECVQSLHLTPEDEGWSAPQMTLAMGEHNVCFVASRGDDPELDEDAQTITWTVPRDCFWADKDVTVSQSSGSSVAVALNRVATKLRVVITDEVPANVATISVKPPNWYYGLNYWTGEPAGQREQERSVTVPSSYVGTTGQLAASFFGLSTKNEWTTDVVVTSKNSDGEAIASVTITAAPFKAGRATEYSGRLFGQDAGMSVTLNDEWQDSYVGSW